MYRRFVELILRRRWLVLAGTVVVTAVLGSQIPRLSVDTDIESFIPRGDDALDNLHALERIFGNSNLVLLAVMREDHPDGIYNPESLAVVTEITDWLRTRPEFETDTNADLRSLASVNNILGRGDDMVVEPFMEAPPATREGALAIRQAMEENPMYVGNLAAYDSSGAMILVRMSDEGQSRRPATYDLLSGYLAGLAKQGRREVFHLTGRPVVEGLFGIYIPAEGRRLMPYVALMVGLFLFVSFGTLRSVLLAFSVIVITEIWMFGFLALWGHPIYTITSIAPVLVIAISVADAIHILARYYQAQQEHPQADRETVVRTVMLDLGRPVFLTSLTTVAGFLSMTTSAILPIRDFGILLAFGVAAAFVLSITYLPAFLAVLPLRRRRSHRKNENVTASGALARFLGGTDRLANRAPTATLATFAVLLLVAAVGTLSLKADSSQVGQFRPQHHLRIADAVANRHFAGGTILDVVLDGGAPDAMKDPELLRRLDRFQIEMEQVENVGDTLSIAEMIKRMNEVMHGGEESELAIPESRDLVAQYLLLYSISGDPGDFDDLIDYDNRYAHVLVFLQDPGTASANRAVADARRILAAAFPPGDPLKVEFKLSGSAYTTARMEHHILQGQVSSLFLCLPTIVVINWIAFGGIVQGALSVVPVLAAIVAAYGTMGYLGIGVDVASLMLGGMTLGIGVDFAIHYLHGYAAYRSDGRDHAGATHATALTSGRALFFNAGVLTGGFLVMLGARFYPQVKLGALVAATMVVCYVSTMLLFPALLKLMARGGSTEQMPH